MGGSSRFAIGIRHLDRLSTAARSRNMAAITSRDTVPEKVVRKLLRSMGVKFRSHVRSLPGCPDIVIRQTRKVIFVHGCFWHLHRCREGRVPRSRQTYWRPKLLSNMARDRRNRRKLARRGWRSFIVWECQTEPKRILRLRERIQAFLRW